MEEQYQALVRVFDYFNRRLFSGILPRCIISFSRFFKMTNGYSIPERWHRANEQRQETAVHEICLSPNLGLHQYSEQKVKHDDKLNMFVTTP